MNAYISILFCIAISHGFPNTVKDPQLRYKDPESNSINNDDLVSVKEMLSRLAEITSNHNITAKDLEYALINVSTDPNDPLEVEPRFVKKAAIASAIVVAAKAIVAFLPFFKIRKVITVAPDATAVIVPGTSRRVLGKLLFFNVDHGIRIVGEISGLTPGRHGMHVHRSGNIGGLCSAAMSHFNPTNVHHGGPSSPVRHIGDLGNIVAGRNGVAVVDIFDRLISLDPNSAHYIGNRAIVIHADEDDLGMGLVGDLSSLDTGNSGSRVGCGLIVKEFTRHV